MVVAFLSPLFAFPSLEPEIFFKISHVFCVNSDKSRPEGERKLITTSKTSEIFKYN